MTATPTQTQLAVGHHARAVRFFWGFLIGATLVSLIGNIVHAIWHLIPFVVIQIGTAAVPPLFLLAVVHGIALSVRAGASGTVYRWAVTATADKRYSRLLCKPLCRLHPNGHKPLIRLYQSGCIGARIGTYNSARR